MAVAGFMRKAPEVQGKHVVVIACGGNASTELLDRAYKVAGAKR